MATRTHGTSTGRTLLQPAERATVFAFLQTRRTLCFAGARKARVAFCTQASTGTPSRSRSCNAQETDALESP